MLKFSYVIGFHITVLQFPMLYRFLQAIGKYMLADAKLKIHYPYLSIKLAYTFHALTMVYLNCISFIPTFWERYIVAVNISN